MLLSCVLCAVPRLLPKFCAAMLLRSVLERRLCVLYFYRLSRFRVSIQSSNSTLFGAVIPCKHGVLRAYNCNKRAIIAHGEGPLTAVINTEYMNTGPMITLSINSL